MNRELNSVKRLLHDRKYRNGKKLFVAEGKKLVLDMINKGIIPDKVLVSAELEGKRDGTILIKICNQKGISYTMYSSKSLQHISNLTTSQGVIAVFPQKKVSLEDVLNRDIKLAVLCEHLQDPANLGMILRCCVGFDAGAIFLTGGSVDVYNPKLVRASSGTVLDIPVVYVTVTDIEKIKERFQLIAAVSDLDKDSASLYSIKEFPQRCVFCFGSEGQGLSDQLLSLADQKLNIRLCSRVDSLNVSVSVGVILAFYRYKHK